MPSVARGFRQVIARILFELRVAGRPKSGNGFTENLFTIRQLTEQVSHAARLGEFGIEVDRVSDINDDEERRPGFGSG